MSYSLLNDKEIRALCEIPETVFNESFYQALKHQHPVTLPLVAGTGGDQQRALVLKQHDDDLRARSTRVLSATEKAAFQPMISNFVPRSMRSVSCTIDDGNFTGIPALDDQRTSMTRKVMSFGVSSHGYDVRLGEKFQLFTNTHSVVIDPKKPDPRMLVDLEVHTDEQGAKHVIMPALSYALGHTIEYFRMPRDVLAICVGKSTYARSALQVNVTPIEPGFEGDVVIELMNCANSPLKVYLEEGIAQFLFLRGEPCETSYADRGGKYQGQRGLTLARM